MLPVENVALPATLHEVAGSANFAFLEQENQQLARLALLAERYCFDDPSTSLIKLRQFAELIAKEVAARHALLGVDRPSFDDVLRALKLSSLLPRDVGELFYHLKRAGNAAAHEGAGTTSEALAGLRIARQLGVWFYRAYSGSGGFKPGPFVPPTKVDPSDELRRELEELRQAVRESSDAEAKARMAAAEAEAARQAAEASAQERAREAEFWERLAAETEAGVRRAEQGLAALQAQAASAPAKQLELLAQAASAASEQIELDEKATRVIIDSQLRAAGWTVDSAVLRYASGARPVAGKAMAIAEWPTASGPADYALFVDGRCLAIVEAKRSAKDVPAILGQAKRYARDIQLAADEVADGGPWAHEAETYRVPLVFATNGRPYVKQLETKSGIHSWDARRPENSPRALSAWFSPRDLVERLQQKVEPEPFDPARELGVAGLRPYQVDAIHAVEEAVAKGQQNILLAMATGTGKTRLALALMYELLSAKRFRRVLFLVDRNALGRQTLDAMSTTEAQGFYKFDQIFNVADLTKKFPEAADRVQVATVQAMIKRVFDDEGKDRPTPGTYDLIIVDEAHRGYTLDAELREDDLGFRNLDDYLSAYRRVLDYFDATRIALTATPALHTREIFGTPVFRYSYRQAVIDGYLIDHKPPRRITTALSQTGITFEAGEEVNIVDTRTGQIDLFELADQVDFEVAEFNKKVYTRPFNRSVADAVALECPPDQPGKTLLFAARDDHADILVEELRKALADLYGPQPHDLVEKITGSVDKPLDRIKAFKNDPRPKYVVTVDLLSTGIDVPAITNLVFVRRVNSRILYEQMIGRATRRCDEIGKEAFRIFDAVDIYANLQSVTDMQPVVVNPALTFTTLVSDLDRAPTEEDRGFVRDQIVVKLRQKLKTLAEPVREALESVLGPLPLLVDTLKSMLPTDVAAFFAKHPTLAGTLDAATAKVGGGGMLISEHEDALVSIEDDFGGKAPADFIEGFEAFVKANMNAIPALVAATQRPRELTRKELKEVALLLDEKGYSETALRTAYGRARNADIAAHIIGFVRQAAIGDPLVPYATRVENGLQRILSSRAWTPKQRQWLTRIGRVLKEQPVGDPAILSEPAFARMGGFDVVDRDFDYRLADVLMDLNAAIWDNRAA